MRRGIGKSTARAAAVTLALFAVLSAFPALPAATAPEAAFAAEATLDGSNASLFLPGSYEQYLSLAEPVSVAVSEEYTAVADGNKLYVYDRAKNEYTKYEHKVEPGATPTNVSKVQIAETEGADRIFFSDAGNNLYEYGSDAGSAEDMLIHDVHGRSFLVDSEGGALFTAAEAEDGSTTVTRYPLDAIDRGHGKAVQIKSASSPNLALEDGVLYCVVNDTTVRSYTAATLENPSANVLLDAEMSRIPGLQSVCHYGGALYYTVKNASDAGYPNGLYRSVDAKAECLVAGDGFTAVTAYRDTLYCICGKSVHVLDGAGFGGYEIAAASASPARLSGAKDVARAGNLLVTADAGNKRVSVYDLAAGSYAVVGLPDGATPDLVATDGETIAVSAGRDVYTCRNGETEFTLRRTLESTVTGLACIYGSVYFVTTTKTHGCLDAETTVVQENYGNPTGMTCDLYGTLYVAYDTNKIYRFTEAGFLQKDGGTPCAFDLPVGFKCVRADFDGHLYALADGKLYRDGTSEVVATLTDGFVYSEAPASAVSFALGFEDDRIFFLFGDYLVRSEHDAVDIPTLAEIPTDGISEAVFAWHDPERLLVDIPAGSVGVRTDLEALRRDAPAYYPYSAYYRTEKTERGVLLAVQGEYSLVVLYGEDRTFTADLFRTRDGAVEKSDYWEEGEKTRYLSSSVSSYFYPCLHPALADVSLARGTQVRVLGTVSAPERDYALVEYAADGTRALSRGYVPVAYLSEVDPSGAGGDRYLLGRLKCADGVAFTADDGDELLVEDGAALRLYRNDDGSYTARVERDGKSYYATLAEGEIVTGESDALRISLIVILSVLAVIIIGVYVYLLPRKN